MFGTVLSSLSSVSMFPLSIFHPLFEKEDYEVTALIYFRQKEAPTEFCSFGKRFLSFRGSVCVVDGKGERDSLSFSLVCVCLSLFFS